MIKIERVEEVPEEIFSCASSIAQSELEEGKLLLTIRMSFSSQIYVAYVDKVPLFAAGAFKFSSFDNELEVWMLGTENLSVGHLQQLRKLFHMWVKTREEKIFAQAQSRQSARFLEFFGFKLVNFNGPVMLYEVQK